MTPEFQGTHLWDRLGWAKQNLEPYRSEFCIVWEDPDNLDEPAKVTHPAPNWMACALNGGILPPVSFVQIILAPLVVYTDID